MFSRITGHILEFPEKDFVVNESRNITGNLLGLFFTGGGGVLFFTVMKVFSDSHKCFYLLVIHARKY